MIKDYQFNFSELPIARAEISGLMGFGGEEMPEPFCNYLDEAFMLADGLCSIKGSVYVSGEVAFNPDYSAFSIEGKIFGAGKLVTRQLKGASKLALFICTAGEGIGQLSQDLLHGNDPAKGYVYDVLGSVTAEKAMDAIQEDFGEGLLASGIKITNRYSPGYCNWDVKDQHQLFSFFPEKHCGISLNRSALMHPIKSVSGVIGLGSNVKFNKYYCEICNSPTCIYRNLRGRDNT